MNTLVALPGRQRSLTAMWCALRAARSEENQLSLTGCTGNLVQTLDYYPYGASRVAVSTSTKEARRYIGQFSDDSSGLSYFNARYYDSGRGQFLSQDPVFQQIGDPTLVRQLLQQEQRSILGQPQLLNAYSYSRDNPITNKDPSGLGDNAGFTLLNTGPATAYGNQLFYSQMKAAGQGLTAAAKLGGAIIFSGVALAADPATLPYVLGGWSNAAMRASDDAKAGAIDRSGATYGLSFAVGASLETPLIQGGRLITVVPKSAAASAVANAIIGARVTMLSSLGDAAGTLAGRFAGAATGYAVGSSQRVVLSQIADKLANVAAQLFVQAQVAKSGSK